jgi:hypothetical protein
MDTVLFLWNIEGFQEKIAIDKFYWRLARYGKKRRPSK